MKTQDKQKKTELGLSEDLSRKQIMAWLQDNLSDKARYDVKLTQASDGNYLIDIHIHMRFT